MPRGSSRQFRTKMDGAAAQLGLGGTANRLTDKTFRHFAAGAYKEQGFAVEGPNVSRIFAANAQLASDELGLAPGQTFSLNYNALTTDALENSTHQALGIANVWSMGWWHNPEVPFPNLERIVRCAPASSNTNFITLSLTNAVADSFECNIIDNGNSTQGSLNARWNGFYSGRNGLWTHTLLTFIGGASPAVFIALNGVDQGSPDFFQVTGAGGGALNQTNQARRIESIGNDGGSRAIGGPLLQMQWWRVDVRTAASFLANSAQAAVRDLNTNSGAYTFAGDLAHWWKPGDEASPNLGKDFSTAGFTPTIDIEVDSVGLTDGDRVADVPS